MAHYARERQQLDRQHGVSRAKDTSHQFETLQELNRAINMQLTVETLKSIRTCMDLILAQYMLFHGEDHRKVEFPDIFMVDFLQESPKGNVPMLCLRLQGTYLPSSNCF